MSLINCPHCGRTISQQRELCPHCYGKLQNEAETSSEEPAVNNPTDSQTETRKKSKERNFPPGRRFLGYRHGNPLYMILSVFYHLCALTGILCALKQLPVYIEQGVHYYYLYSIALAAIMMFLPAILFSHTRKRQAFSRCGHPVLFTLILLIIYLLLGGLCLAAWTVCH